MNTSLDFRIEWLEAPGVTTPELAAAWARYEMWLGGRCVTQVETADGTFRRGVYGSLYPLAFWIASNWWLLTSHVRSIAVLRPFDIEPRFLRYSLASGTTQDLIESIKGGMGVPHLFQWDIKRLPLDVPPLDQQRRIADFLDAETARIDQLISAISVSSALLQGSHHDWR